MYYIYGHVDPTNKEVVYIGHGSGGRAWREGKNEKNSHRSQEHQKYLHKLAAEGYIASDWVVIIARGISSKKTACLIENALIRDYKPVYNRPQGLQHLKVTPELLRTMKQMRAEGKFYREISDSMDISTMTVHRALNGMTKNLRGLNINE